MVKKFIKKSGLSPVVTTVLLITLTIAITVILFLWFRGMVEEGVTKFGKNIRLVCEDVNFDASYSSGTLNVVNNGDVPIFRLNVKTSQNGNYQTKEITDFSGGSSWPATGLPEGGTFSGNIGSEVGSSSEISLVPILIGASTKGKRTFVCEGQYGKELTL
jgi:hypothetical protein